MSTQADHRGRPGARAARPHHPDRAGDASRVLARTGGGNLTLFAFDAGQGLTEHKSPFEALVMVLEGELTLTIGGVAVQATPGRSCRCRPTSACGRRAGGGADAAADAARRQAGLAGSAGVMTCVISPGGSGATVRLLPREYPQSAAGE